MNTFNDFLQQDICNNSLMKGILQDKAVSSVAKQIEQHKAELKQIVTTIVSKFLELLRQNPMLGVEILFRFPSREIKDAILTNYEGRGKVIERSRP